MISVVIPVYNAEATIARTLSSLKHPMIKQIICVDDGSTDRSQEIIEQIKELPLQLIRQENKGAAAARNRGMSYVTERFVLFVDSDDYLPEQSIDHYLTAVTIFPEQAVYVGGMSYLDRTGVHHFPTYANFPDMEHTSLMKHPEILQSIGPAGKLYAYDAVKDLSFDEDITFCEEHTFNLQVFKQKVVLFNRNVYIYNKLNDQSITTLSKIRIKEYLDDAAIVRSRVNILLVDLPDAVRKYYSFRMDKQIIYYLIKNAALADGVDEQVIKRIKNYIDIARIYGKAGEIDQLSALMAYCAASLSKPIYDVYIGDQQYAVNKRLFHRMKWQDSMKRNVKKLIRR